MSPSWAILMYNYLYQEKKENLNQQFKNTKHYNGRKNNNNKNSNNMPYAQQYLPHPQHAAW